MNEINLKSTERFSNRVENYIKYRPHYPYKIVDFLKSECCFSASSIIADIGSGTGISAEIFLNSYNTVYGIEPNREMRKAAEEYFENNSNFISINGTAEDTTLEGNSIDFIISGQAFHWFDKEVCKNEFERILKNIGYVILMWNLRVVNKGFMSDYEKLLIKYGKDYEKLYQDDVDETEIRNFFYPTVVKIKTFPNFQEFDYAGLKGRLLSSSYIPLENNPFYNEMIKDLEEILKGIMKMEKVRMEYKTMVYYGKLK